MPDNHRDKDDTLRDGLESLPEPLDMPKAPAPYVETDDDLDEALRETFPASDPAASLRTA